MNDVTASHPRLPATEVTLLWFDNYWDGPLSGLCVFQGREHYFWCFAEAGESELARWYRRFSVHELSPEQLSNEKKWHELFREKVGTHWEPGGKLKPQELHHEFYDAYKKRTPPHYELNCPIIGWFER